MHPDLHSIARPEIGPESDGSASNGPASGQAGSGGVVVLDREHREALAGWARMGYPHETCGLLVGRRLENRGVEGSLHPPRVVVSRVVEAPNLNTDRAHDRYELDPSAFVAADLAARSEDLEVVGFWHSHPDSPARPSETDRRAAWEGYSYLIASVTPDGLADLRSWRLEGADFLEEDLST